MPVTPLSLSAVPPAMPVTPLSLSAGRTAALLERAVAEKVTPLARHAKFLLRLAYPTPTVPPALGAG